MLRKIKEKATILYMRLLFGKFVKKIKYHYKSYNHDIYLFKSKKIKGGQCTPFNTIIIQEVFFEKYSKNFRDYLFLHELGHVRLNILLKLIFDLLILPILYLFFMLIPLMLIAPLFFWVMKFPRFLVITSFFIYLIMFLAISLAVLILYWSIEGHAELFAIRNLCEKKYLSAHTEMKRKAKHRNIFQAYFYYIRYPPKKLVLWFYRKRR